MKFLCHDYPLKKTGILLLLQEIIRNKKMKSRRNKNITLEPVDTDEESPEGIARDTSSLLQNHSQLPPLEIILTLINTLRLRWLLKNDAIDFVKYFN